MQEGDGHALGALARRLVDQTDALGLGVGELLLDILAGSADVLCIRAKENTDSKYLYYLLSQQAFFDYVMSGAKGCKMPRGDKKQIMQWPVNIPAIDVQKKVVAILSSLDNKIRLNRRINDNLAS